MYRPRAFRENDPEELIALARAHPFATLVSQASGSPSATHLPLMMEGTPGKLRLRGHLARGNTQWQLLSVGDPVLAIFLGDHHYVSPSWYRAEPDVPTWNYLAVHARGYWQPVTEEAALRRLLHDTVDHFERPRACPWSLEQLDEALTRTLQRGVVGFDIEVEELVGVRKLSQDKCTLDREGVAAGLAREDDDAGPRLAEEIRRR